jgi:hypothetical protein
MLGTFVAGAYTTTLQFSTGGALAGGITEKGWSLRWIPNWNNMENSDSYGQGTTIEKFWQGLKMYVSCVALEWKTNIIKAMQPMNSWAGTGVSTFNLGTVGAAATDNAAILVMSSTANTPAAASPTSMTFTNTVQDSEVNLLFGPEYRTMPLNLQVIPYSSSGIKLFSST